MISRLIDFALVVLSFLMFKVKILKFLELLEPQKSRFSIFLVLKGLKQIKKFRNHSKPLRLGSHHFYATSPKAKHFLLFITEDLITAYLDDFRTVIQLIILSFYKKKALRIINFQPGNSHLSPLLKEKIYSKIFR